MIQQLQLLNSFLILIAISSSMFYFFLLQVPPQIKARTKGLLEAAAHQDVRPGIVPEFIFQNDLFATFNPLDPPLKAAKQISAMPSFSWPSIIIPPAPKEMEMLPALNIILNGIVLAADEEKSVAIISDETLKEQIFYNGDQVKDAFIAKIMKNRVIFFRSNGQQETFFLRRDEDLLVKTAEGNSEWKKVIIPLSPGEFQVDPEQCQKKIASLGAFIELFQLFPSFQNNQCMGIQCEEKKNIALLQAFGLASHDLILSINNIMLTDQKKMLKAYQEVVATKENGTIDIRLMRNKQEVALRYTMRRILSDIPLSLSGKSMMSAGYSSGNDTKATEIQAQVNTQPTPFNKINPRQEKVDRRAMIENEDSSDYYDTVMKIRKRLIDNMHKRSPHTYMR